MPFARCVPLHYLKCRLKICKKVFRDKILSEYNLTIDGLRHEMSKWWNNWIMNNYDKLIERAAWKVFFLRRKYLNISRRGIYDFIQLPNDSKSTQICTFRYLECVLRWRSSKASFYSLFRSHYVTMHLHGRA